MRLTGPGTESCVVGKMTKQVSTMLTTTEAAARLGVTPEAVRKAIKRGHMTATKHGRDWLVSEEEVERYADKPRNKGGRPRKRKAK